LQGIRIVFGFLKRKKRMQSESPMRELMFGDLPWDIWCRSDGAAGARVLFRDAWAAARAHDPDRACRLLRQITEEHGLESQHHAQAWHFLRELGHSPPPEMSKRVLGAIVEVSMPKGFDVLGAYEDHTARYWNFNGRGAVWKRPDGALDACIDALLDAARRVVAAIGPRDGTHPPLPERGSIQISMLTPSGLHFESGHADAFGRDHLAGPVIACGAELLEKLTSVCGAEPDK
jgi:hypothetical protein